MRLREKKLRQGAVYLGIVAGMLGELGTDSFGWLSSWSWE